MPLWRSKAVGIIAAAALLVVAADVVVSAVDDESTVPATTLDFSDRLFVQPSDGGVYLLGNSMFKTGIDPNQLADELESGLPVDFEYHNGHYSNLWYLIAQTALGNTEADPRIVVWGFRPGYANRPAFRQNRGNETDLFAFDDPLFDRLSLDVDFSNPPTISAANVRAWLDDNSGIYGRRDEISSAVADTSIEIGIEVLDRLGIGFADRLRAAILDGERTLADEITRLVTDGEVVLTEELVVDGVGDFTIGPLRTFDDSFIPATAGVLRRKEIPQAVIIFRPVVAATGEPVEAEEEFVDDALRWFGEQGIPVLDLYHDERLVPDLYASGDHYNDEGRRLITSLVADFLDGLALDHPAQ